MPPPLPTWQTYAGALPFRLGVLANEISQDFAHALDVAGAIGIREVELHSMWGRQITDLADGEIARAATLLTEHGMRACMVTDAAFKMAPLESITAPGAAETATYREHREMLERAIAIAHRLDCPLVRVFGFRRPEKEIDADRTWRSLTPLTDQEVETLRWGFLPLCALARREGVTLILENVRSCYLDTGANSAQALQAVDSPQLKIVWDPANAFCSGEYRAYPDGYTAVRPHIGHFHVKDARIIDPTTGKAAWTRIGAGEVDLAGQLQALVDDRYAGIVSIETHWKIPGDTGERATLETWRGLAGLLDRLRAPVR